MSICLLVATGVLTDEGINCRAMRGDDGELYTLQNLPSELATGDRIRIDTGGQQPPMFGLCDQGQHVHWLTITRPATDTVPESNWSQAD